MRRIALHSEAGSERYRKPEIYQNIEFVQSLAAHAHTPERRVSVKSVPVMMTAYSSG